MTTLTQVFYNKIVGAPTAWYHSKEGRKLLAKMARMIKTREGRSECKYFLNLVTVNTVLDI